MVSRLDRVLTRVEEEGDSIIELTRCFDKTISWLFCHSIIKPYAPCPNCGSEMLSRHDKAQFDKYYLLCDNCGTWKSIRYRTFFEDSKLTLLELVRIVFYYFIEQKTLREVTTELKISKGTLIKINRQLQELISQYIQATYIDHQLGEITVADDDGENENGIVDIDETLFCHLGRIQIWVFGLVDRVTKEFRAFVVQDRTADTLIPIIRENVRIGAIIYSDGWRSYSGLGGLGYDHRVVIHDQGFGQGQDTTNSIESCWSHLKRVTRQSSGIQPGNEDPWTRVQEIVDEGIWRMKFYPENLKDELIHIINTFY